MAISPAAIATHDLLAPRVPTTVGRTLWRFAWKKPLGAAGGAIMLVIIITAVFADLVTSHDPLATNASQTLARPSASYWLGTDNLGRDIYSRVVHGARVSLIVGLASSL